MPVIWSLISCGTSKAGLSLYISTDIKKFHFQQVVTLPPPSPEILLFNTDHIPPPLFFFLQGGDTAGSPKLGLSGWIRSLFGSQAVLWIVCWKLPSASGFCFIPFISLNCRSHDIIQCRGTGRRAIIQPVGEYSSREARVCLISNHIRLLCLGQDNSCYLFPSWMALGWFGYDKIPDPSRFQMTAFSWLVIDKNHKFSQRLSNVQNSSISL